MFDGECQRLVNTVNDILDLGKVDNRSLVLTPVSIPMVRLVARHVESIRVQAETKRLALALAADAEAGFVACDPEKMGRVVQNILANAIKFTPSGGTVEVTVGRDLPDGRRVTMTVTDTGIGIPAEALGHITERYFRAGNPPTGSGLGLALSQEIVTLHGGSLEVCSPPPGRVQGTQVTVRLPAVKAPMLLVVDDDPAACRALEAQLGRYGYRVVTCETAQEGLRRVEELEPNALILDLILPDLPGVEVLQRLKASSRARFLPVVALTGANVDEARAEVLQRFAIPVVAKPWHEAEMLDQIEGALIGMAVFHPRRQDAKGAEDEGVAQTQRADH
jgi:CheY-like chemotaxis protein/anti-sigma regulatory factor (Ser/Thr protein kinase)